MSQKFRNKTSARPWIRKLVSGFSLRRLRFNPKPVHVVFVKTLKVFSEFFGFSMSLSFHHRILTYILFIYHQGYMSSTTDRIVK